MGVRTQHREVVMAFWIGKRNKNQDGDTNSDSLNSKKKKDEKKSQQAKRIDNLRIPHQLKIVIRSLGTPTEFTFHTRDLSSTGAFVLCKNFKQYPFVQASTILDCMVEINADGQSEATKLRFLARIMRVVDTVEQAGFGVKMIQISPEQKQFLDNYIQRHGAPEILSAETETEEATSIELDPDFKSAV